MTTTITVAGKGGVGKTAISALLIDLLSKKVTKDHGFHPMVVPLLVKERVLYGSSHFPEGKDQVYKIEKTFERDHVVTVGMEI